LDLAKRKKLQLKLQQLQNKLQQNKQQLQQKAATASKSYPKVSSMHSGRQFTKELWIKQLN
jgi:DNA-binding protein YbaB